MIESEGLVVEMANNGKEAVKMVSNSDFDVVLMDVQMPEMDGFDATRLIRENPQHSELPIIAMTAHAMSGDREKCLAAGMNDYITKPIEVSRLFDTLGKWVKPKKGNLSLLKQSTLDWNDDLKLVGIDTATALKRMGGKRHLYSQLLLDFHKNYKNVVDQMKNLLEKSETEKAHRLAHTLKGLAGTLGLNNLLTISETLEKAFQKGQKITPKQLKEFEEIVTHVMNTLADFKEHQKTNDENLTHEETDSTALKPLLQELAKLLYDGNLLATDLLPNLRRHLNNELLPLYSQLNEQLENYEFEDALKTLNKIAKRLNIAIPIRSLDHNV